MHFLLNGKRVEVEFHPRTSLLDLLRDHLQLHGSKKGCNQGPAVPALYLWTESESSPV
ncbi:MAG: xanthine dehydrogenase YagT iron-sulfur-binding subunit [Acidobacteriaceae bacterium]|jgi:xanthine dehydrogenase YagT iron-sulfur-binding subunit|nr:xanthine dehydrogenase YagT iron-sulfur-binding subunit [Acidobacteriaceae bacterium]